MTNEEIVTTLQYLVGSRYVPTVKAYIGELTDRQIVVGPNDITTMDYNLERVRIEANDSGLISGFAFS